MKNDFRVNFILWQNSIWSRVNFDYRVTMMRLTLWFVDKKNRAGQCDVKSPVFFPIYLTIRRYLTIHNKSV